jgi:hypothetical protein
MTYGLGQKEKACENITGLFFLVPRAGIEPARPVKGPGF